MDGALTDKGKDLFARHIPADAQAVIVAELHRDDSDTMTDYFNHQTTDTIIIGWSSHTKDLFSEMRKAALRLPETAHLGPGMGHFVARVRFDGDVQDNGHCYWMGQYSPWHRSMEEIDGRLPVFRTREAAQEFIDLRGCPHNITVGDSDASFSWNIEEHEIEHREKYSMGGGYYLKDGARDSSGWCIRKRRKYRDAWDSDLYTSMENRCIFGEQPKPEPPAAPSRTDGATITENAEKNGVEIRFPSKPAQGILDSLKANGWRWSKFGGCWYNRNTPESMAFAQALTSSDPGPDPDTPTDPTPSPRHTKARTGADISAKLRTLADGMGKAIDGKINSGISQQNPTRRRLAIADSMRRDGEKLQKVQHLLRCLADMHEAGTVPPDLSRITTKAAAHDALFGYRTKVQAAIDLANGRPQEDPKAKTLHDLDRELFGCKIPGFFITPEPVARRLVDMADIRDGMDVCEPEAGRGDIAQHINHGSNLTCIEYNPRLAHILEIRGFNAICEDFMEHTGAYDRIVMNPPFENGQDIDHVRHAYDCLRPGGRMVAIMGEGVFFRSDRKASDFREWLDGQSHTTEKLESGAFMGTITSTGVATRIVLIDK